ncbi:MAG TPA: hypothetical protein VGH14_04390 [Solirubrobacterales bacterium]
MTDARLELADLGAQGGGDAVLERLDGVRVVIEAPADRCRDRADQVALYTMVNLAARLFPHLELRLGTSAPACLGPLMGGELGADLADLAHDLALAPSREPAEEFHLAFGVAPTGNGLAGDAAGWSYSVGPDLISLEPAPGPPFGAIACATFLVAQLFATRMAPLGLPVAVTEGFTANLLDLQNRAAPAVPDLVPPRLGPMVIPGCGSVGSSLLLAAILAGVGGGPLDLIDPDRFSVRNVLRYPVLRHEVEAMKVEWLAELAEATGLEARPHRGDIQAWLATLPEPPVIDLAAVSVDTIEGRRDATDLLARRTLNLGVGGLSLHMSSHGFADDGPCAYCQYVDVAPTLSGSARLAEMVGLSVERVVELNLGDGLISAADAAAMAATGRFGERPPREGERLADLRRRIYAQAAIPAGERDQQVLVSAPFVSQLGGLLLAAEALKISTPELADYRLAGRYDVDLTGPPPGFTRMTGPDESGRCLCHSAFRRRAFANLHGLSA